MKAIDGKKMLALSLFELKTAKKQILAWVISVFGIMFLYMILFSSMQEMAKMKMEAMPKELLQFVGMEDFASLSHYISYFGMIFNLILIAVSLFATTFAASLLCKEEQTHSIEFLSSLPISRLEIYLSKMITACVAVILLLASTATAAFICGLIGGGDTFILMDFIQIVKISSLSAFVFLAVGLCLGGTSSKIGAPSLGSLIVLVSYVLGFLSSLLGDKAQWLRYFSPFEVLSPQNAIVLSSTTLLWACLYVLIVFLLIFLGANRYQHRDL